MVQVQELEVNPGQSYSPHFELRALLHMDVEYYKPHLAAHVLYGTKDLWRSNECARAMGNSRDPVYLPDLIKAFQKIMMNG